MSLNLILMKMKQKNVEVIDEEVTTNSHESHDVETLQPCGLEKSGDVVFGPFI